ncbi:MAG TPA: ribosome biogenesis GTPase Der [Bacteroidales bacterium]|nr:ribosome biogenesis GTPase Der [Bacteroidales bacterium]
MGNIVAIIGRPNVGKSTFFNRMVGYREAIVEETSGVTRDRHYGKSDWNGVEFTVIDTGGFVEGGDDAFEAEIRKQVVVAANEADVVLFMVDVKDGLTGFDKDVANHLRPYNKKCYVVANKVDNNRLIPAAQEFYALGMGDLFPISAVNGSGTGDLLDEVVTNFDEKEVDDSPDIPHVAVVGRPNAGKSSLINALLGNERNIVTDVAGTTRDTINTRYNAFGFDLMLLDTAGLRKKAKVKESIEFYSTMRAIKAIEKSDVCVLMLDATQGIESQDLNILNVIHKNHKGVVVVVNKWDLVDKDTHTAKEYSKHISERLQPFKDVPIIFTSVMTKQRIFKVLESVKEVYESRSLRISTKKLNDYILPVIENRPPSVTSRGKYVKIKYVTQLKTAFPAFAFFCNYPKEIKTEYKRFLENQLRKKYNFTGVPLEIFFREK